MMFKRRLFLIIFLVTLLGCKNAKRDKTDIQITEYKFSKTTLVSSDSITSFDFDIKLSEQELKLNREMVVLRDSFKKNIQLKKLKFYNEPFHKIKDFIEGNRLFRIFKSMPKGGLLHSHSGGIGDVKWVIERAKELPNCYVYNQPDNKSFLYGQLGIYKKSKVPVGFISLKEKIDADSSFESELYNLLVLDRSKLKNTDNYWLAFEKRFLRIMPLISYRPFFKEYYEKSFLDLIEDNIYHIEIRFIFGNLYDQNNASYSIDTMVDDLNEVVTDIQKTKPEFSLHIIYTSFKFLGVNEINHQLEEAFRLKKKYPGLITGFDLVAEEDRGNTINFYKDSWRKLDSLERVSGFKLPLFLHAGESNSIKNKNLYDAILLKTKRIGHGLNLVLYPSLIEEVKKNNILVEVNPLSNQILGYVSDLRNHPARVLLNNGVQCSISSDDPGVFGYEGLSYDFFMVFIAWELDLKAVKKLVFNSIEYSTLNGTNKKKMINYLEHSWVKFVDQSNELIRNNKL